MPYTTLLLIVNPDLHLQRFDHFDQVFTQVTSTWNYLFTGAHKHMLEKIRENIVGDPPIVFPRKAFVDDT